MNDHAAPPAQKPPLPRELLHPRYWALWAAVVALGLLCWLPRRWRDGLGARIGEWQHRHNPKRRGTVELNLSLCFPDWSQAERDALAREHFRAYGRSMLDQPLLWWDRRRSIPRTVCRVEGIEHVHEQRRQGRSVILIEPHTTGLEFGGGALTRYTPYCTIGNELGSPLLDWLVTYTRARFGVTVFRRSQGLRPVIRALRQGTVFFYMPDEDFGDANSVFAPFFGQAKATLTTVGRLAERTGAAVVPMYAYYRVEERVYHIVFGEPLASFPSCDPVADATRVNEVMEAFIRQRPEAYMWGYRLFRHRPDGSRRHYPKYDKRTRRRRQRRRRAQR